MEDEPAPAQTSSAKAQSGWARQLEKGFSAAAPAPSRSSSARDSNPMVKIVGYDAPAGQGSRQNQYGAPQPARQSYGASQQDYGDYGGLSYGNISGVPVMDTELPFPAVRLPG